MRALMLAAAVLFAACGDNKEAPADAGTEDAPAIVDAPAGALTSCVDRPTDLPRPPTGGLSCDMLPPGLTLEAP